MEFCLAFLPDNQAKLYRVFQANLLDFVEPSFWVSIIDNLDTLEPRSYKTSIFVMPAPR